MPTSQLLRSCMGATTRQTFQGVLAAAKRTRATGDLLVSGPRPSAAGGTPQSPNTTASASSVHDPCQNIRAEEVRALVNDWVEADAYDEVAIPSESMLS